MTSRANRFGQRHVYVALVFLIGLWGVVPAGGGITVTGNLDPAYGDVDPWVLGVGDLVVGDTADGSLEITLGSSVQSFYGALGFMPGTTGSLTVTDANSAWTTDYDFLVGVWGHGDLEITNGGQVISNDDGYIGGCDSGMGGDNVAVVGYDPNGTGQVLVSGAGSSWTNTDVLYVGYANDANMIIADGGQVSNLDGLIGYEEGAEADVTVSGPNSVWVNTDGLGVGIFGNGDLLVEDGGRVTSLESGIGIGPNSVGTVTVTGADSLWSNPEELAVGGWGTGTLTIANGGQVTNGDAFIGGFDLDAPNVNLGVLADEVLSGTGTVEVTGSGSRWDSDGFLYVGYTGTGTLDVNDGGLVTSEYGGVAADPNSTGVVTVVDVGSQWSLSQALAVGAYGDGELTVAAGGLVDANEVYVGGFDTDVLGGDANEVPVGIGTVTVTGAGSQLDVNDFLYVGYTGTGTLDVNDGGLITSEYGAVAADPNSTGTVAVSGTDSQWTVSKDLAVGAYGQGDLTISDGGSVGGYDIYVGGFDVVALGGDVNEVPEGTGMVTVTGAGSEIDAGRNLYVGYTGTGEVAITDGGRATSHMAVVGYDAAGNGVVTVSGDGSTWETDSLFVAYQGQGQVLVEDGGLLNTSTTNSSWIGSGDNGTGVVTVRDPNSRWITQGMIHVGGDGDGTLNVSNGAQVTSTYGRLGNTSTGVGQVNVTGTDSQWTTGTLTVGNSGEGTLAISAGGTIEAGDAYVGLGATSLGHVTVSGSDSLWAMDEVYLGTYGQGDLTISTGGRVTDANAYVAMYEGSTGVVTVTGANSTWVSSGTLRVGQAGDANMVVSDGGTVESVDGFIGYLAGSAGQVTVTGADALWRTGDLNVGYVGTGSLVISSGGAVDVNEIIVGNNNVGTLLISDGGTLDANSVSIGLAKGLGVGTATVTGAGSLWTVDGGLYIGGMAAQAGGTGMLDVNDGGVVTADEVRIWNDGTLGGDGTLTASTVLNSGTIAPGNSIGTLTIDGDLTMDANSVFAVEIDNSDNSDKLVVTGDAQLAGTVQVASDETIRGTHEYTILDANSVTGEFDTVDTALVQAGAVTADLGYGATVVTLEVTALPFDIGQTRNQRSLGTGLETIAVGGGNAITSLLQGVPTDDELLTHYDQLGGQSRSSLAPITVAGTSRFMGAVSHRLRHPFATSMLSADGSAFSGQAGQDATSTSGMSYEISTNGYNFAVGNGTPYLGDRKWGFWGKGYGLFGSRDDDVESPGYDYTTYGVSFGLDYQVSEKLLLGVTTGYGDGDVDYDRLDDSSDLESTHFGLYGTWDAESLYVDSLLTYTDLDYETERNIDLTNERFEGDFGGYALSGYFETGFDWRRVRGWLLQPLASFQLSYLDLDSYTESGGDAALGYDDQSYESYKGSFGMKVTKNLLADEVEKSLVAQFRARWLHEFGDTYSSVDTYFASEPTTVFAIRDADMARDSAVLGVGLGAQLNGSTRLYADYDVRLNVDDTAHFVSAGLRYQW